MTLVYPSGSPPTSPLGGGVHAFVLGVGAYPDAKAGRGVRADLQVVADLPSAANSAQLVVDWLITNKASLSKPLASIELLSSAPTAAFNAARPPDPPADPPTTANVRAAGRAWRDRCANNPGSIAVFFSCGHGAVDGDDTVVFLADLNSDPDNPWAKLNVRETARAFKLLNVASAHFFVDACQEFIPALSLSSTGVGARFTGQPDPFAPPGAEKVALLTAAAPKLLAYEGDVEGQPKGVRAGRFTQTLLQALGGAAARDLTGSGDWAVHATAIFEDLKPLYRLRPEWRDLPFDPTPRELPNEILPIVTCVQPPKVPILVKTDPSEAIGGLNLSILGGARVPPPLCSAPPGALGAWTAWVTASLDSHWLLAETDAGVAVERAFTPSRSLYTQLLKVPQ